MGLVHYLNKEIEMTKESKLKPRLVDKGYTTMRRPAPYRVKVALCMALTFGICLVGYLLFTVV